MIAVTSRIPPLIDFSADFEMQTVIASGKSSYQGHPTTLQMPDGTILCTWTIGHGGSCGPMAKSSDGGRTWRAVATPENWKNYINCPTIFFVNSRGAWTDQNFIGIQMENPEIFGIICNSA